MKKFFSILMAVICVFSLCAVGFAASAAEADGSVRSSASAPPFSEGYDGLLNHRTVTTANNGKKYTFYSPVIDANDATKYPVLIYIHGLFHGRTDKSFVKNGLVYRCSQEMQEKFKKGVLLCATGIVSADKAKKAANVPVWEVRLQFLHCRR